MISTPSSKLLTKIAFEANIDAAYNWLRKQCQHYPANTDIWDLCYHWSSCGKVIIADILDNRYTLSPQQRITLTNGNVIYLWKQRRSVKSGKYRPLRVVK